MAKKTKKSVSKTKKVHRKTVGFTAKVVKEIQTLFREQIGKKITLKEIRAMLRYLLDNYNDISYKKGVLTLQTGEYDAGIFDITLDLTKLGIKKSECHYHVLTLSPTPDKGGGCEHIYSSGRLCFGNGWSACQKSIAEGRLDDFVDIVQAILRT